MIELANLALIPPFNDRALQSTLLNGGSSTLIGFDANAGTVKPMGVSPPKAAVYLLELFTRGSPAMAAARLCMRQVKRVFHLHFNERRSQSEIAQSLGIGKTTVREYLNRLNKSGLQSWSEIEPLDEAELERRLGFLAAVVARKADVMPDWSYVHREMAKRHVTLILLWTEYYDCHGDGDGAYGYTQFRTHYNRWCAKLNVVMRQSHKAGEKTFIDYSGDGLALTDPKTGEVRKAELFIAVLGASSYTYAEATLSQTSPDWISSRARMASTLAAHARYGFPTISSPGFTRRIATRP